MIRPPNNPGERSLWNYRSSLLARVKEVDPSLYGQLNNLVLPWYTVQNQSEDGTPSEDNTDVFIYAEIGGLCGVSAERFVEELSAITTPQITVRINSPGGNVFDSISIHNALRQHDAYIITRVDALAASGASIVAMAGDTVEMGLGSQLMIHDALMTLTGNPDAMERALSFLHKQSDNIASMYAARTGATVEDWRARMRAETWFFAQEAIDIGLADSMYVRPKKTKPGSAPTSPPDGTEDIPPSDAEDEEGQAPEDEEPEDEEATDNYYKLNRLMAFRHRINNRGYRYAGRKYAPAPFSDDSVVDVGSTQFDDRKFASMMDALTDALGQ